MNSLILTTGARFLVPLFLVFSVYVLLRGHNAPGGGFIGGLIAASGFTLIVFTSNVAQARQALKLDPTNIGITGLVFAIISGVLPIFANADPFSGVWFTIFGYGVSNVILFDTGVYLAVVGGILGLIFALEESK